MTLLQKAMVFLEYFTAIPENEWCSHVRKNYNTGQCCALGFIDSTFQQNNKKFQDLCTTIGNLPEEELGILLYEVFPELTIDSVRYYDNTRGDIVFVLVDSIRKGMNLVARINNGLTSAYRQPTEKQRIIAVLNDVITKLQSYPQVEDITSKLAVLPVDEVSDIMPQKTKKLMPSVALMESWGGSRNNSVGSNESPITSTSNDDEEYDDGEDYDIDDDEIEPESGDSE